MEALMNELSDAKQQLKERDATLQMAALATKQLVDENQSLNQQIEAVIRENTAKIEELEQDRYSLKLRLAQQTKMGKDYLEELETVKLQMSSEHQSAIDKLTAEHSSKVTQLNRQITSLRTDLDSNQATETQLLLKIDELESTVRRLQAECEARCNVSSYLNSSELDSLAAKLEAITAEKIAMEQEHRDFEEAINRLKFQRESLSEQIRVKDRELEEKECQVTSYYNALEKTREEVQELKMELELAKIEANSTKKKGNSLFAEVEDKRVAAEKQLISVQVQNESLKRQLELSRQNNHLLKIQMSSLLQLAGVSADMRHLESITQQLSQANGEIQSLASELKASQQEVKSLKTELMQLTSSGQDSNYVRYLQAQLQRKEKDLEAVNKDLQTRRMLMLAETEKLVDYERRLYASEQQLGTLRSQNVRLQLRIDELRMKYEPDAVITGTRRKVKVEKIPVQTTSSVMQESSSTEVLQENIEPGSKEPLLTADVPPGVNSQLAASESTERRVMQMKQAAVCPSKELPRVAVTSCQNLNVGEGVCGQVDELPVAKAVKSEKPEVISQLQKSSTETKVGTVSGTVPDRKCSSDVKTKHSDAATDLPQCQATSNLGDRTVRSLQSTVDSRSKGQGVVMVPPAEETCRTQ